MKKAISIIITLVMITALAFNVAADAEDVPAKKTQIDWLISGAGGDVAALGGNPEHGTGMFSYSFSSEDGSITGRVEASGGIITITGSDEAIALASIFTAHFATLPRSGHFHASHRLSAKSTEEFPTYLGSPDFITFCYDANEDGGMMNAMVFENAVKLVFNLSNGGHAVISVEEVCELDVEVQSDAIEINPKTGVNNIFIPAAVITSAVVITTKKRKEK
jgi:hypothetical protein